MKRLIVVLAIILTSNYSFCSSMEDRVIKLEQTVKAQSDSIATYKAKVAEVEKQKSFLGDIYSTNVGWASLVLTLLVGGAFAVMALNIIDNSGKVKEIKTDLVKYVNEFNKSTDVSINKINNSLDLLKKDIGNIRRSSLKNNYDLNRTQTDLFNTKNVTELSAYYYLLASQAQVLICNSLIEDDLPVNRCNLETLRNNLNECFNNIKKSKKDTILYPHFKKCILEINNEISNRESFCSIRPVLTKIENIIDTWVGSKFTSQPFFV